LIVFSTLRQATLKSNLEERYRLRKFYKAFQIFHHIVVEQLSYLILVFPILGSLGGIAALFLLIEFHRTTNFALQILVATILALGVVFGHTFIHFCAGMTESSLEFRNICLESPGLTKFYKLSFETCYPLVVRIPYISTTITKKLFVDLVTQIIISNAITAVLTF